MSAELEKMLVQLAEKLGTTVEHLWGVLSAQAQVQAWVQLALGGVGLVLWLWLASGATRAIKLLAEDEGLEFGLSLCRLVGLFVVTMVMVVGWLPTVDDIVTGFCNPEYWALKEVLKGVGR